MAFSASSGQHSHAGQMMQQTILTPPAREGKQMCMIKVAAKTLCALMETTASVDV